MNTKLQKVLVIGNDKLGDFVLSLPSFALLKKALPDCSVHALVPEYTREIAEACQYIDRVIIDPGAEAPAVSQRELQQQLRAQHYDAAITLFSTTRIGWYLLRAHIPYRLAPATKIAQIFYNRKLKQRRSRSEKPEYVYNLELANTFLADIGIKATIDIKPPYLQFPVEEISMLRRQFCQQYQINTTDQLIFIHPGSGGSANNLSLKQYAKLAQQLTPTQPATIIISCGPDEVKAAQLLGQMLPDTPHIVYVSKQGLHRFAEHIQFGDLFISGSTGPLHIAGALDTPTAAFYPSRRSATALRWKTLNSDGNSLAFSPEPPADEEDMQAINISQAAQIIREHYKL